MSTTQWARTLPLCKRGTTTYSNPWQNTEAHQSWKAEFALKTNLKRNYKLTFVQSFIKYQRTLTSKQNRPCLTLHKSPQEQIVYFCQSWLPWPWLQSRRSFGQPSVARRSRRKCIWGPCWHRGAPTERPEGRPRCFHARRAEGVNERMNE